MRSRNVSCAQKNLDTFCVCVCLCGFYSVLLCVIVIEQIFCLKPFFSCSSVARALLFSFHFHIRFNVIWNEQTNERTRQAIKLMLRANCEGGILLIQFLMARLCTLQLKMWLHSPFPKRQTTDFQNNAMHSIWLEVFILFSKCASHFC